MANEIVLRKNQPPAKRFDEGYYETESVLEEIQAELESIYGQAYAELKEQAEEYLAQFTAEDSVRQEMFEAGEISEQEYQRWRQEHLMRGRNMYAMVETAADNLTYTNNLALSIINGYMPEVYAINGNFTFYQIEKKFGMYSAFTIYNEEAVERLVRENPRLLPKKKVNIPKDKAWNRRTLNRQVAIGIIEGDTIDVIAERIAGVADMNYNSAVRNAATMTTSAQNGGRLDAMNRAKGMGINAKKRWLATADGHTRPSHRLVDGEVRELDEKFSNGLMFPGDPDGAPAEVYNCRCCLIAAFEDSEFDGFTDRYTRVPEDMTYEEWKHARGDEPFFKAARNVNRNMNMHEEYSNLYKQHKEAFTQAVPENFNDFQELKYNNTDAWKQMVSDARKARKLSRKNNTVNAVEFIDKKDGSAIIKEKINNGEIKLEINSEKQGRHIKGSIYYKEGRSYLTISESEAQKLVYEYSGTGEIKITKDGQTRETIIADRQIGYNVSKKTKEETPTNAFKIHYSKTGTHIVPTKRSDGNA